jgi:hypothetical protein
MTLLRNFLIGRIDLHKCLIDNFYVISDECNNTLHVVKGGDDVSSNDAINTLLHYTRLNYSEPSGDILTIDVMLRIVEEVIKDPSHNDKLIKAIDAIEYDNTDQFNEAVKEFQIACEARALKLIDEAPESARVRENRSFSIVFDQIIRLSILRAYVDISDDHDFMKSTGVFT